MEAQIKKDDKASMIDKVFELRGKATIFLCGGMAGCLAKTTVAPLDRVKILLQTHNHAHESHGIFGTLRHIWSVEGIAGFYRSNGAQMIRIFPYSAIQFLSFDVYNNSLSASLGEGNLTRLISGSMAGMTAVSLTYPLDVVRTRLAYQSAGCAEHPHSNYSGIADCLRHLRTQRALFAGLAPSLLGMAPYAGVSFCAFHWLQRQAVERWPGLFAVRDDDESPARLCTWARPLIGGLAGAAAQTVSYPLDCARRYMQVAGAPGRFSLAEVPAAGAAATLSQLYSRYGVAAGLYRGLSLNYVRVVPTAGVSFAAYETLRQAFGV
ncbi:hypothetical protein BOX15_Mlig034314g1 [Macrostomum lignano]|uniref:Mitochondrial carrier protein n=1 Tax=Macrostomum lignano TaxID=282301 RepID=A0A267GA40_9PLAT|nr:hypothetical protein BOX15_Mlig034314g1 [Macrostomum lignano]